MVYSFVANLSTELAAKLAATVPLAQVRVAVAGAIPTTSTVEKGAFCFRGTFLPDW